MKTAKELWEEAKEAGRVILAKDAYQQAKVSYDYDSKTKQDKYPLSLGYDVPMEKRLQSTKPVFFAIIGGHPLDYATKPYTMDENRERGGLKPYPRP